jgi:hypothetical protein
VIPDERFQWAVRLLEVKALAERLAIPTSELLKWPADKFHYMAAFLRAVDAATPKQPANQRTTHQRTTHTRG